MRGDRKSVFFCLLIITNSIWSVSSQDINEFVAALDPTDKISQTDPSNMSLQQQRLDEIRALIVMQNKAAAEKDARERIARTFKEAADRHSAASSTRGPRDLAEKEVVQSSPEEFDVGGHEAAAILSNPFQESAARVEDPADIALKSSIEYGEQDRGAADVADGNLNLLDIQTENTTPEVIVEAASIESAESIISDIDHEDDAMKEVSTDPP